MTQYDSVRVGLIVKWPLCLTIALVFSLALWISLAPPEWRTYSKGAAAGTFSIGVGLDDSRVIDVDLVYRPINFTHVGFPVRTGGIGYLWIPGRIIIEAKVWWPFGIFCAVGVYFVAIHLCISYRGREQH